MSDINVTPFVDVMLVLLVIFMISAPLLVNGVKVNLPKNSSAPIVESNNPFSLTINNQGEIFYQKEQIPVEEIEGFLRGHLLSLNTKIYIRGDKDISYGVVMSVIAEINRAGYSKVSLVTNSS